MKTETFKFIEKAIDCYGNLFFQPVDIFEDDNEWEYHYYYPTFHYCHVEDTKKTHAIMIKNETPLWLCCMQAIRESDPNLDIDEILEDMKYLRKENLGRNHIILY